MWGISKSRQEWESTFLGFWTAEMGRALNTPGTPMGAGPALPLAQRLAPWSPSCRFLADAFARGCHPALGYLRRKQGCRCRLWWTWNVLDPLQLLATAGAWGHLWNWPSWKLTLKPDPAVPLAACEPSVNLFALKLARVDSTIHISEGHSPCPHPVTADLTALPDL